MLGEEHPTTIHLTSEMTGLGAAKGLRYSPLQRNVVELSERALGPDDSQSIFEIMRLGQGLGEEGYLTEAEALLTDAMERAHRVEDPNTLAAGRGQRWLAAFI